MKFNPCFHTETSGWIVCTSNDGTGKTIGQWFDDPLDAIDWAHEKGQMLSEIVHGEVKWVVRTDNNENAASGIYLDGKKVTQTLDPSTL